MEYIINEAEIYDEVDIVRKLFNLSEVKTSNAGNQYIDCTIIDTTNRVRSMKVFGDLMHVIKEHLTCKLTDMRVLLGAEQRKVLHTTTSTACVTIEDEDVVALETEKNENETETEKVIEGIVISVDVASLDVLSVCSTCSKSGFWLLLL